MPTNLKPRDTNYHRQIILLAGFLLYCSSAPAAISIFSYAVNTNKLALTFSYHGAQLRLWEACAPTCNATADRKSMHFDNGLASPSQLEMEILDNPELTRRINSLPYTLSRNEDSRFIYMNFRSAQIIPGVYLQKNFRISKDAYIIHLAISIQGIDAQKHSNLYMIGVRITPGQSLESTLLSGFSSSFEKVNTVIINETGSSEIVYDEETENPAYSNTLEPGDWSGIRSRFWTLILQNAYAPVSFNSVFINQNSPRVTLYSPLSAAQPLTYNIYSGPVALQALADTDQELVNLLYPHLWFWMRWICFALYFILTALYASIGNYGLAIMALALAVKLLMLPLTATADKWQHEVNEIHTKLQPQLQEIKSNYRGEEQVQRIHALHKEHDTHMFFPLKSLFGFLIQIPIFIAAYTMLGENFALDGESFLWIKDLAQPDHFLKLPFTTPFFGGYLNLLPFIMTLVTILASLLFDAHTLSADLQKKQQRQLYLMALLFFVLFYTFPAAMVLYWTSTNLIQLVKDQILKMYRKRKKPTTHTAANE